jgi:hypothetical protein
LMGRPRRDLTTGVLGNSSYRAGVCAQVEGALNSNANLCAGRPRPSVGGVGRPEGRLSTHKPCSHRRTWPFIAQQWKTVARRAPCLPPPFVRSTAPNLGERRLQGLWREVQCVLGHAGRSLHGGGVTRLQNEGMQTTERRVPDGDVGMPPPPPGRRRISTRLPVVAQVVGDLTLRGPPTRPLSPSWKLPMLRSWVSRWLATGFSTSAPG